MTDQNYKHFESRCETADKNASQNFTTLSGNVQKTHAHFTQEIERIYSSSAAKDAEHDGKFDKLDGVVEHLTNHFEEKIGNTDRNSTAKVAAMDERLNRLQQHFTDVVTTMDGKQTDKDEAQDAAHSQLSALVNTNYLSLVESCEALEKRVNESATQFQQDFNHCNTTCATLENLITAEQKASAERLNEARGTYARQHLELTDMVSELSRSVTAQYETLDARFNEEFTRVKDYCNAVRQHDCANIANMTTIATNRAFS